MEDPKTISIILDDTSPVTSCSPSEGTYSKTITITLTATDDGSGINETYYKIGEGEWTEYIEPFDITEPGNYTIYYYSIDKLGNNEEIKSISYIIKRPVFPLFWLAIIVVLIIIATSIITLAKKLRKT
jgi:hypothetical protein